MSETIVQKKTARLVQRVLSEVIQRGGYVQGVMPSISVVRMSPDLGVAKVYVTVFPDRALQETVDTLNEHVWEIRKELAQQIRNKVKMIPELTFYVDDSFIEAEKIEQLLNEARQAEEPPE